MTHVAKSLIPGPEYDRAAEHQIQEAIVKLIKIEPFFGAILSRLKREQTRRIKTLGVSVSKGPTMIYNPDFFRRLDDMYKRGALKHEICHVIFKHFDRRLKFAEDQTWLIDICFDLAINSILTRNDGVRELPHGCLFPDMDELKHLHLQEKQTAEYYYEKLKDGEGREAAEKLKGGEFDEHGEWGEATDSDEIEIGKLIEEAYHESKGRGLGGLPFEIQKELEKFLFTSAKLPWQVILHNNVLRWSRTIPIPTRMKPNRRYGYLRPGYIYKQLLTVTFIVDTSGSVNNETFRMFVNELAAVCRSADKVNLIHCDEHPVDMGEFHASVGMPKRKQRGGTRYDLAIRYAETQNPDIIVYMTDGQCSWNFEPSKIPVLWIITSKMYTAPTEHGRTIHIS